MRGLGGFVLLAGIGVGLFVYFPAPVDRDTSLAQAKRVASFCAAYGIEPGLVLSSPIRRAHETAVIFAKELPALPLFVPVYSYGVNAEVQGVQVAALYEPSDRLATFTNWYLLTRRALQQPEEATQAP